MKLYLDDFPLLVSLEIEATWNKATYGTRDEGRQLEPDEAEGWAVLGIYACIQPNVRRDISFLISEDDLRRIEAQLAESEPCSD